MKTEIALKIINDPKMHDYLITHSYWYKYLNRDENYYKEFVSDFKNAKRNNNMNKVSSAIDTLDTVNLILKTLK